MKDAMGYCWHPAAHGHEHPNKLVKYIEQKKEISKK